MKEKKLYDVGDHYLQQYDEEQRGKEHHDEGIDEPGHPVYTVTQSHNLHHFL